MGEGEGNFIGKLVGRVIIWLNSWISPGIKHKCQKCQLLCVQLESGGVSLVNLRITDCRVPS